MCNQSIQELASIAINSANGGNENLLKKALRNLQEKPPSDELFLPICSIIVTLKKNGINGSFMEIAEQIFNTLQ